MEPKKSIVFIINPKSGHHMRRSIIHLIEKGIDKEKYDYSIEYTQYAGHAHKIARDAVACGINVVTAVGGDGTINEVARSLVNTSTALAIIPCGSGNGLARHLGIPDARHAIEVINGGITMTMDYGIINNVPFFCTCGVGFDAFISFKFASSKKRGFITYINKTLTDILKYKPDVYEIEDEEQKVKYKAFLVACANASQYGNNAYIAPHASLSDGYLDITILEPFSMIDIPTLSYQLFNKRIEKNSHIKTMRCKKVHISRKEPGVVHFDGDPMMADKDLYIEVVEKGLNVITPEEVYKGRAEELQQTVINYFNELREDLPITPGKVRLFCRWVRNFFLGD